MNNFTFSILVDSQRAIWALKCDFEYVQFTSGWSNSSYVWETCIFQYVKYIWIAKAHFRIVLTYFECVKYVA